MKPIILFLLIAVIGNVLYHIGQKTLSQTINPMLLLMTLYALAFILAAVAYPFFQKDAAPVSFSILVSRPILLMTLGAFLVKIGLLLAYRTGGSLQWSGSFVNGFAAIILIPIALIFFKEHLSLAKISGIILAIAGLALLACK
jgi:drug/metabolite transporter (DMT)-like permease